MIRSVDAKTGTGEAAEAFAALGKLKPTDAAGRMREPLELLDEVADRLKKLPTQSDRLWVVDSIFGDQGAQMLKMLKDGSQGLRQMRLEARSLGHVLSSEAVADADRFTKALKRLQFVSKGVGQSFIQDFFRPLSWLIETFSNLAAAVNNVHVSTSIFQLALTSLLATLTIVAIKAARAFAPMLMMAAPIIGKVALMGAALMAIVVIVEDLWVAFRGGNSVFLMLWQKFNAFCLPADQWLAKLPKVVSNCMAEAFDATTKGFAEAWRSISKEFAKFSHWLTDELSFLAQKAEALITGLVPNFLKKGFSATLHSISSHGDPTALQARMAPSQTTMSSQNRFVSNQNLSVAVNVKSGANPQVIGGEITKALRLELERERLNAFMGVSQYAS